MKVPRWNNVASPRGGSSRAGAPSPVRRTLAAALAFANAPQICLRYGVCACIRLALLMLPQAGQGGGTKASACANRNEAQEEGGAHEVVQRLCSQGHTLAGVYRNSGSNSHSSSSSTSCSNIRTAVRGGGMLANVSTSAATSNDTVDSSSSAALFVQVESTKKHYRNVPSPTLSFLPGRSTCWYTEPALPPHPSARFSPCIAMIYSHRPRRR